MNIKKTFLFLSLVWIAVASFFYMENLAHHPKSYIEHFQLRSTYDCFGYVDDLYRKEEAMDYAKAHGNEAPAKLLLAMGFRFLKPVFSLQGYLTLILAPIIWSLFALLVLLGLKKSSKK